MSEIDTLLDFVKHCAQSKVSEEKIQQRMEFTSQNSSGNEDDVFWDGASRAEAWIADSARKLLDKLGETYDR